MTTKTSYIVKYDNGAKSALVNDASQLSSFKDVVSTIEKKSLHADPGKILKKGDLMTTYILVLKVEDTIGWQEIDMPPDPEPENL